MSAPDKIEAAIVDVIARVGAHAVARKKHDAAATGSDWRNEKWRTAQATTEILSALVDLAHQENYQAAASKCRAADCGEWLYDLVWYRGSTGSLKEVVLAAESEWAAWTCSDEARLKEILYDFEKLMVARTEYRLIIFEGSSEFISKTFATLESSVRAFTQTRRGDRYQMAGWNWDEQLFKFEHVVI